MSFARMGENRNSRYINAFGKHLRELRSEKGLSQEELAYKCGTTLSQIGRFERGERSPTLSTLLLLARGLGVDPKTLLDFEF
jgi:transcriptional regulator with XRE-family HTH domain